MSLERGDDIWNDVWSFDISKVLGTLDVSTRSRGSSAVIYGSGSFGGLGEVLGSMQGVVSIISGLLSDGND